MVRRCLLHVRNNGLLLFTCQLVFINLLLCATEAVEKYPVITWVANPRLGLGLTARIVGLAYGIGVAVENGVDYTR